LQATLLKATSCGPTQSFSGTQITCFTSTQLPCFATSGASLVLRLLALLERNFVESRGAPPGFAVSLRY
jgi:hypothetical protein